MAKFDFRRLTEYMDYLVNVGIPACECVVYRNHEQIYQHGSGFADSKKTRPAGTQDLYYLFSVTKTVTCAAAMQLVEQGQIRLEDPVEKYLPEYGQLWVEFDGKPRAARRGMTIENLFTMTGGLGYDMTLPEITALKQLPHVSCREAAAAFIRRPLLYQPGEHYCYSWCHDVLAAVVEEVSGMRFGQYLEKRIFQPLGMKDCSFSLEKEQRSRMSAMYYYDNGLNTSEETLMGNEFVLGEGYESGGAGLIGSAGDMGLFADALACGGMGASGQRILEERTVEMMQKNRLTPVQLADFRRKPKYFGYGWGLCGRVNMDPVVSGSRSPVGEFGWSGAAGAYLMADCRNRLSVFYVMHVRKCEFGYERVHAAVRNMTYEILGL